MWRNGIGQLHFAQDRQCSLLLRVRQGWAGTALGSPSAVLPDFTSASTRCPPRDQSSTPKVTMLTNFLKQTRNVVASRFVFEASKIAELKVKAASMSMQCPTRFEAVTAILWNCTILASGSRSGSHNRLS